MKRWRTNNTATQRFFPLRFFVSQTPMRRPVYQQQQVIPLAREAIDSTLCILPIRTGGRMGVVPHHLVCLCACVLLVCCLCAACVLLVCCFCAACVRVCVCACVLVWFLFYLLLFFSWSDRLSAWRGPPPTCPVSNHLTSHHITSHHAPNYGPPNHVQRKPCPSPGKRVPYLARKGRPLEGEI